MKEQNQVSSNKILFCSKERKSNSIPVSSDAYWLVDDVTQHSFDSCCKTKCQANLKYCQRQEVPLPTFLRQ